jgi:hypothetical protein
MVGFIPLKRFSNESWRTLATFFIPTNLVFVLLGLFTLQTSGGLNIFNFLIVPIVSFVIFASFNLSQLRNRIFVPVIVVFVVLTLPRSVMQLHTYWQRYVQSKPDSVVNMAELEMYGFIRQSLPADAVVQAIPLSNQEKLASYTSFFSERQSYIAGIEMLKSHNQPTTERLALLDRSLSEKEIITRHTQLRALGITHLLVPTSSLNSFGYDQAVPLHQNTYLSLLTL